ncbi:MAG TPA: helix-turn-helix domain-containing protein [Gemmataceae bacterium]|nr:helix-turn-helix domain-containing protein [Gemmataceae bacterium]
MHSATIDRQYFDYAEAERYTRLSRWTLRRLAQAGKLRALHPSPGRVVFDRCDLDEYMIGSANGAEPQT